MGCNDARSLIYDMLMIHNIMNEVCKVCKTYHNTIEEMDKCIAIRTHMVNSNLELHGYESLRD